MGHFCFCFNRRQMSGTERRGSTPFLKFVVGGCQQCASGNIIEWVSLMNVLPIWLTGTISSKNWRSKRLLMATRPTFNAADKHLFYLWERKAVRQFDVCETVRWWREEKKKKPFISGGTRVRWTSICQSVSVVCQRSRFLLLSAAGPSVCTPKIDHYTARIGRG